MTEEQEKSLLVDVEAFLDHVDDFDTLCRWHRDLSFMHLRAESRYGAEAAVLAIRVFGRLSARPEFRLMGLEV